MAWVLGHLDDLASDFSAIHGVRDITALSGRVFLRLAYRLPAYQGVMRERLAGELREQEGSPPAPRPAPGAAYQQAPGQRAQQAIPGTRAALQAEAGPGGAFPGVFSFGSAKKA